MSKAYQIWKAIKLQQKPEIKNESEEKKKVADKTMSRGRAEGEKRDYKTSDDLRGKDFRDLIS